MVPSFSTTTSAQKRKETDQGNSQQRHVLWDLQGSLWAPGDRNITRQTNTPPSSVELGNQGTGQPPSRGKWRTILTPLGFLELFKNDENRPSCAFPPIASLQPLLKVKAEKLRNDHKLNWTRYQLLFGSGSLKPEGHALVGKLGVGDQHRYHVLGGGFFKKKTHLWNQ